MTASATSPDRPRVVLVRHGETAWSRAGRHTGRTDVALTSLGEQQARAVGPVLAVLSFSLVLVSPLTRARETCRLAGFADRAVVDADLLEWDYGDVEGRTTADVRRERPGWLIWDDDLGEGERLGDVAARADRVIERVLGAPGDVLLFGHGHQLRVLTARWCELSPVEARRFRLDPATTSELGWEHEYRTVRAWNRRPPDRS